MGRITANTVANLLGRAWSALLGLILVPFYINILGVEAYGLIGFFSVLQAVLALLDLGAGSTVTRELARLGNSVDSEQEQHDVVRTFEILQWGAGLLAALACLSVSGWLAAHWLNRQSLALGSAILSIRLMGLSIASQLPMSIYQSGLLGLQRHVLLNGIQAIVGTVRGFGVLAVMHWMAPTIEVFFAWQALVSGFHLALMKLCLNQSLPKAKRGGTFRRELLDRNFGYAATLAANSLLGVALTQLDKLMLSRMLNLESLGYYMVGSAVAASLWSIIVPINNALFPQFVDLQDEKRAQSATRLFHTSSQVMSVALMPLGALLVVFSYEILLVWTGREEMAANTHHVLSLLALGVTLNGITSIPMYASIASGWPKLVTLTNLGQAIFLVPGTIVLSYYFSSSGAALAWALLHSTYLFVSVPIFFRKLLKQERDRWFRESVARPLLVIACVGLVGRMLLPPNLAKYALIGWLGSFYLVCVALAILASPGVRLLFASYLHRWRNQPS